MNNYHTHTFRCGHGYGMEEDMVLAASNVGISELGFSEHVPLPFYRLFLMKGFFTCGKDLRSLLSLIKGILLNGQGMRMPYSMKKSHEAQIRRLQQLYDNKMMIYQGYECEYFKPYLTYYQKLLNSRQADYLILGHHFHRYPLHQYYFGKKQLSDEMLISYRDEMIEAMATGLFSYVAHPDLFLMGRDSFDDLCQEISYDICYAVKKYGLPLELNAGGIRKGYIEMDERFVFPYANEYFFEIASKVGNDIILGIDAHHPDHFSREIIEKLEILAKKKNLHLVHVIQRKGI